MVNLSIYLSFYLFIYIHISYISYRFIHFIYNIWCTLWLLIRLKKIFYQFKQVSDLLTLFSSIFKLNKSYIGQQGIWIIQTYRIITKKTKSTVFFITLIVKIITSIFHVTHVGCMTHFLEMKTQKVMCSGFRIIISRTKGVWCVFKTLSKVLLA